MTRRLLALFLLLSAPLAAQEVTATPSAALARARTRFDQLDYVAAIAAAREALASRLTLEERKRAWEIIAFGFAATDSAARATDAFAELLLLDADYQLDARRVSPKITPLFASALGRVLVVRDPGLDSATFVAGQGGVTLRYTVSREARVVVRLTGPEGSVVLDSARATGTVRLRWDGRLGDGAAAAAGPHRLLFEATAGRDRYERSVAVRITRAAVDTVPHLLRLPGYDTLPTTEIPPRSWKPLGIAVLATALAAGATIAVDNGSLAVGGRRELIAISGGAIAAGLWTSLRRPPPVPAVANIRYNDLLREQLARENQAIAEQNVARRRQVALTVVAESRR